MADRSVATTDVLDTLRTTYNSTAADVGDISSLTGASGLIASATDIVEAITLLNTEVTAIKAGTATFETKITFEGDTADAHETVLAITDPTADRTITFPDASGTIVTTAATQTLTNKTLTAPVTPAISPTSVAVELNVVLNVSSTSVVATDLSAIILFIYPNAITWVICDALVANCAVVIAVIVASGIVIVTSFACACAVSVVSWASSLDPSNIISPVPICNPVCAPVKVNALRRAPVKVLFVRVCVPDKVATLLVRLKVTVVPEALVPTSVPPEKVNVAPSKSIGCDVPLSGAMSKSCRVVCASTYALMDC